MLQTNDRLLNLHTRSGIKITSRNLTRFDKDYSHIRARILRFLSRSALTRNFNERPLVTEQPYRDLKRFRGLFPPLPRPAPSPPAARMTTTYLCKPCVFTCRPLNHSRLGSSRAHAYPEDHTNKRACLKKTERHLERSKIWRTALCAMKKNTDKSCIFISDKRCALFQSFSPMLHILIL